MQPPRPQKPASFPTLLNLRNNLSHSSTRSSDKLGLVQYVLCDFILTSHRVLMKAVLSPVFQAEPVLSIQNGTITISQKKGD